MKIPDRPRITIDVSPKQYVFLRSLPHGWNKQLFNGLINMLMDMTLRLGPKSLGVIVREAIDLEDYFKENQL